MSASHTQRSPLSAQMPPAALLRGDRALAGRGTFDFRAVTSRVQPLQPQSPGWPATCLIHGMSAITFKVNRKNGDYVKSAIVPANHTEEAHFGLLDGAVIAFFLMGAAGLICLLLLA